MKWLLDAFFISSLEFQMGAFFFHIEIDNIEFRRARAKSVLIFTIWIYFRTPTKVETYFKRIEVNYVFHFLLGSIQSYEFAKEIWNSVLLTNQFWPHDYFSLLPKSIFILNSQPQSIVDKL